jgi:RNA polymerase sigma-70 factor (ECF subfamily)
MGGDTDAFERLAAAHMAELHAYCYQMLGSVIDADDALQDTLIGAWRGLAGFEGRSSLRTWLYRIATHACLRLAASRRRRLLSAGYGPDRSDVHELGEPVVAPVWLEPYPDPPAGADSDPAARYRTLENVELAFVAALQYLPARQRAVLILRDVLQFSGAEVARALDTSVSAVNSALQRARRTMGDRVSGGSQQAELAALGERGRDELIAAFVSAWERSDVDAMVALLAEDARFSMPPLPAWFAGQAAVLRLMTERMWATSWRLVPVRASAQLAFACYQGETPPGAEQPGAPFRLSAINVLTVRRDRIAEMTAFLDPVLHRRFGLPEDMPAEPGEAMPAAPMNLGAGLSL